MTFSEFKPEIDALKANGFEIGREVALDYGETLALWLRKDGKDWMISLIQCRYDTMDEGNRIKRHGVVDIRDSQWSKDLRRLTPP